MAKTPNEIALNILFTALALIFVFAVATTPSLDAARVRSS